MADAPGTFDCARCGNTFYGEPVIDEDQLLWTGKSETWCSEDCLEADAEDVFERNCERVHEG